MYVKVECEPDKFIPTRESLLSRLRDWSDDASWEDFFQTYWRLIYNTALKAGLSDAEAQDAVQETVVAVSKAIREFKYDPKVGSFKQWLLNQTHWRITDQFRKRRPEEIRDLAELEDDIQEEVEVKNPVPTDLEKIWDLEWDRNVLEIALERVKLQVDSKHFQIYDLYVLREWPVAKVAEKLNVTSMQVYLAKHRVGSLFKREVRSVQSTLPNL